MSWQATSWAIKQQVGNAGRKLLLIALANYADKDGVCWPSQARLTVDVEASLDTIQRQTKKLVSDGFISKERPPKRRGQWQTFIYRLNMPTSNAKPQNAARSSNDDTSDPPQRDASAGRSPPPCDPGVVDQCAVRPSRIQPEAGPQSQAAPSPKPGRTAMRLNPSKENPIEPSGEPSHHHPRAQAPLGAAARRAAWQMNQAVEVVQDCIARRLGRDGWTILMQLGEADLERITELQRQNLLTDEELSRTVMDCMQQKIQTG